MGKRTHKAMVVAKDADDCEALLTEVAGVCADIGADVKLVPFKKYGLICVCGNSYNVNRVAEAVKAGRA